MSVALADIQRAAALIAGAVVRTPAVPASRLSHLAGAALTLKLENLQDIGSFKQRGALVKLKSLPPDQAKRGVIAMSAGNHAQGVAYHAQRLGMPATIVMPEGTPFGKIERTSAFGARVILHGDGLDQAGAFAAELAAKEKLAFVHPYDDPLIVAGQGTVALELLADVPELDCIVVPIGGGGIISGIAIAAKALKPGIEIVGVQAALYPAMVQALRGEKPSSGGETIAEGIAVKSPGKLTLEIVRRLVDDILLVDEPALEQAVMLFVEEAKQVVEGAGAAGLAAVLAHRRRFAGRKVALVVCGGNIDSRLLGSVLMRGLVREGRVASLRIDITDRPGTLAQVAGLIGATGGNIIEIHHQRLFRDVPAKRAELDAVVETRNAQHVREIVDRLRAAGFKARVLGTTAAG
ncbi:MAG: threonine ammonia-lyase [Alphaproteobacteria bacterium]|nr:threonine ammonia-lyase [Alphaproteobacteria bacterium]